MSSEESPAIPVVLFVDDDLAASRSLIRVLESRNAGINFKPVQNEREALLLMKAEEPEAVVLDLSLDPAVGPDSGLRLLKKLHGHASPPRVLVLTGHDAEEVGVTALQAGAASFLEKPADPDHLLALLKDAVSYTVLRRSFVKLARKRNVPGLISRSPAMQEVVEAIRYCGTNRQPVLICGETGAGKGVVAREIHNLQGKSRKPFIRFQPSFRTPDLVSSEIFGHKRGAFTGAIEDRRGLLEEAHEGTFFIDEVAELPEETQIMLLNVLQEKVFRRIGGNADLTSDFRLLAATNRTLDEIREKKLLRPDFYHRIAHVTLTVPPLRKRKEDILELADFFLATLCDSENIEVSGLADSAVEKLLKHDWPGNVRELQAAVEGGAYRATYRQRRFVEADDLTIDINREGASASGAGLREKVQLYELKLCEEALEQSGGNQSLAAARLQLDRSSFRRILGRKRGS